MVSLRCGFLYEPLSFVTVKKILGIWGMSKESRLCVSSCDSSGDQTEKKSCYTGHKNMICLCCGFSCVPSGYTKDGKRGHTAGIYEISPHYGYSCESLNIVTWRMTLYTLCMCKEFCQCAHIGEFSGH